MSEKTDRGFMCWTHSSCVWPRGCHLDGESRTIEFAFEFEFEFEFELDFELDFELKIE